MSVRFRVGILSSVFAVSILSGCSQQNDTRLSNSELHGESLFGVHCADCHEGTNPDLRKQPPKLGGLFRANALPSGAPATDEQVRKTIIEGRGTMPAFDRRLRKQDVDDLVKYLHTLESGPMFMRRLSLLICFAAVLAGTAWPATGRDLTPDERKRYDEVTYALIAPCCWRAPIAIHRSPEALQMLAEVRQMIIAGRSNKEIESFYVARYGVRILADPPGQTRTLLGWVLLGVVCLLSALMVQLRAPVKRATADLSPASADLIARVRAETNESWT